MISQKHMLGSILLCVASYAIADNVTVYRWVDSNNVVHFSQHQPKHDNYTELLMSNSVKPEQNKTVPAPVQTTDAPITVPQTKDKCEEAKANVKTLMGFDKIQYTDTNGVVQVLNETEKAQQLEINKKQVEVYCGS